MASIGTEAPLSIVELSATVVGALMAPNCDLYTRPALGEAFDNLNYWVRRAVGAAEFDPWVAPILADDTPAARAFVAEQVELLRVCAT